MNTPLGIAALALLTACSDQMIVSGTDKLTADTGEPDAPTDTGAAAGKTDPAQGDDTAGTDPACGDLTFTWTAPFSGWIVLYGELSTPDGVITQGWRTLAEASGREAEAVLRGVCAPFVFRGIGAWSETEADPQTSWSCMRQSTEAVYAVVGEVGFAWDGEPVDWVISDAPESDGCELTTVPG